MIKQIIGMDDIDYDKLTFFMQMILAVDPKSGYLRKLVRLNVYKEREKQFEEWYWAPLIGCDDINIVLDERDSRTGTMQDHILCAVKAGLTVYICDRTIKDFLELLNNLKPDFDAAAIERELKNDGDKKEINIRYFTSGTCMDHIIGVRTKRNTGLLDGHGKEGILIPGTVQFEAVFDSGSSEVVATTRPTGIVVDIEDNKIGTINLDGKYDIVFPKLCNPYTIKASYVYQYEVDKDNDTSVSEK